MNQYLLLSYKLVIHEHFIHVVEMHGDAQVVLLTEGGGDEQPFAVARSSFNETLTEILEAFI